MLIIVFKEKERSTLAVKKEVSQTEDPIFIPVVGAHDEPELKLTTVVSDTSVKKRKNTDHNQLPSDDYHYDKFKKKAKRK